MADGFFIDPLGRTIGLSDATWFGHIVRNHREMAGYREAVGMAIERPIAIRFSVSDADCRLFYGPSVVRFGFTKTAYLTRRIKPGAGEWP